MLRGRGFLVIVLTACAACWLFAATASAETITVANTNDSGAGSLRQALATIEPEGTVIVPAGTYSLSTEQLDVTKSVTIAGAGAETTIITAKRRSRVLKVVGKITVKLSGLTITEGLVEEPGGTADGGGIYDHEASLTLENCVVSHDEADSDGETGEGGGTSDGGGIFADGPLQLDGVSLVSDTATAKGASGEGGGIAEGGGFAAGAGGSFTNVTMREDTASAQGGPGPTTGGAGGIAEAGGAFVSSPTTPVTLSNVSVSGSLADASGGPGGPGGIAESGGLALEVSSATVSGITVSGNTANASGGSGGAGGISDAGGISASVEKASTIVNATVEGNTARSGGTTLGDAEGGGAWLLGGKTETLTVTNATIDSNIAEGTPSGGSGGNLFSSETVDLRDTIISAGTGAPNHQNCGGTVTSLGDNIEDLNTCGLNGPGDKTNTSPVLLALASNGGPVQTQGLGNGSPAIDAGASCAPTDARGVTRPQGAACEIGAYEVAPALATTGAASAVTATSATISGSASDPDALAGSASFQFGTTTAYGTQTSPVSVAAFLLGSPFSVTLTGLKPTTVYHYRATASSPDGSGTGADATFTTLSEIPQLNRLALSPSRLKALKGRGASLAAKRGAKLSYVLNEAAKTTFTVLASKRGFRAGSHCLAHRPSHHRGALRRCKLLVGRGSFSHSDKGGVVALSFTGRVANKALAPGAYVLRAVAKNAAGFSSAPATVAFSVVR